MRRLVQNISGGIFVALLSPLVVSPLLFAATADVSSVENFIRSIIQMVAGLAGLVATGFFVYGGFSYIVSSGNPERLDRAKKTLLYAAVGLAIVVASFVIANIIVNVSQSAFGK